MKDDAPSATANIVAQNIVLVSNTNELSHLVDPDAAKFSSWFVESFSAKGSRFVNRSRKKWFQVVRRLYERESIPGLALHQALRKLYIERLVRESLGEGFGQVVVLGGGLDSLCLRLHREFPDVNFLEIDHPATQLVKQKVVQTRDLRGGNLKLVPLDFTKQTLEECLGTVAEYQSQTRTVFVCEGVLMYLDEHDIHGILRIIKQQAMPGKRFIFTFMEPDRNGKTNFINSSWLVQFWLEWKNEPFKWGISRNNIREFLEANGFTMKQLATDQTLRSLYLNAGGLSEKVLAIGENICRCDC